MKEFIDSNFLVWIVDDNEELLKDLSFALGTEGIRAKTYSSSRKFLNELDFNSYGCIILDIKMPEISGDVLQDLLVEKNCPIPIIFLSGHGDMNLAIHTFRKGAFDFIPKPLDPDYLISTIKKVFSTQQKKYDEWLQSTPYQRFRKLTARQKQVLLDLVQDLPTVLIAEHLNISLRTVERHRQNGLKLCGVKTINELKDFIKLAKNENKKTSGS